LPPVGVLMPIYLLANARRMGCDLAPYPALLELEGRCLALEAFQRASPERQPDYLPD
ncbi:hypothetical protein K3Z98_27780, partial [Pseudomonas aeruginosa]|nr:hypothetical protein [Pseudomonas aeruginosa]